MSGDAVLPAPEALGADAGRFRRDLARCDALLARHLAGAVQRFGAAALDVIDLPSLAEGGQLVPEQMRAVATLFWASEIEQAGLPQFTDALAEGAVTGRVFLPLTSGAAVLARYWEARRARFTEAERLALYERIFGAPGDAAHAFRTGFRQLCEQLAALGARGAGESPTPLLARIAYTGRQLAQWISDRGTGVSAYAAREIVNHVKAALQVLRDPDVALALGGAGPWQALQGHAPQVLGRQVDPQRHLDLAASGLRVLSWLADVTAALAAGAAVLGPDAGAVQAATLWLAASERS
jgi:hypothetical protein